MEDKNIIELYFARDQAAVEETKGKYGGYCIKIAENILGDRGMAEECLNDTLFTAWKNIPPECPVSFSAYLGRIIRNHALNRVKAEGCKKRGGGELPLALDELEACLSGGTLPHYELEAAELASAIDRFLSDLQKRDRDIFVCRYYFVYPIGRIARAQGLSSAYVRVILSRLRTKLKKFLAQEELL